MLGEVGRGRVAVLGLSVSLDDGSLQSVGLGGFGGLLFDGLGTGAEDLDGVVAVSHKILVRVVLAYDDGRRRRPDVADNWRAGTREDRGSSRRGTIVERTAETVDLGRCILKEFRGRLGRERRGGSDEARCRWAWRLGAEVGEDADGRLRLGGRPKIRLLLSSIRDENVCREDQQS